MLTLLEILLAASLQVTILFELLALLPQCVQLAFHFLLPQRQVLLTLEERGLLSFQLFPKFPDPLQQRGADRLTAFPMTGKGCVEPAGDEAQAFLRLCLPAGQFGRCRGIRFRHQHMGSRFKQMEPMRRSPWVR